MAKQRAEKSAYDMDTSEQRRDKDALVFDVQAHVFNSSQVAPMSSNIVRFYR